MNFAVKIADGKAIEVFANELKDTPEGSRGYFCLYDVCGVELTLCSYTSENKKAPYFRPSFADKPHVVGCPGRRKDSGGDSSGIDNSKAEPYVSKLVFPDEYSTRSVQVESSDEDCQPELSQHKDKERHNHTVRHIAPLIRWYVENPNSGKASLEVPECIHKTYETIFQRVHTNFKGAYVNRHIYFGSLHFMNPRDSNREAVDGTIVINIHRKDTNTQNQVTLNTKNWTNSEINRAISWINNASKASRKSKDVFPYIFFLGEPENNGEGFICERHEEFYAIACENLYLKTNNIGLAKESGRSLDDRISVDKFDYTEERNFAPEPILEVINTQPNNVHDEEHESNMSLSDKSGAEEASNTHLSSLPMIPKTASIREITKEQKVIGDKLLRILKKLFR